MYSGIGQKGCVNPVLLYLVNTQVNFKIDKDWKKCFGGSSKRLKKLTCKGFVSPAEKKEDFFLLLHFAAFINHQKRPF